MIPIYIPIPIVSKRITDENAPVRVLETDERWYGVTYKEDTESVRNAMAKFINEGLYEL